MKQYLPKLCAVFGIIALNPFASYALNSEFDELYNNYYNDYYYDDQLEDTKTSISDYTLYFDDYNFDYSKEEDWDKINIINHNKNTINPYQQIEACTFIISSIQKRVCVHNKRNGGFKIKFKNAAKSLNSDNLYDDIELDWDNDQDWSQITHSLSDDDIDIINKKYINDMLKLQYTNNLINNYLSSAVAAHTNLLNNYYYYTDYAYPEDPFTQEMADTLTGDNDEQFYDSFSMTKYKQQQMQQMQPMLPYSTNTGQQNMGYTQNMPCPPGAATMSSYGCSNGIPGQLPNNPQQLLNQFNNPMFNQQISNNPNLLRQISDNPHLLALYKQQTANGGPINPTLEALLRQQQPGKTPTDETSKVLNLLVQDYLNKPKKSQSPHWMKEDHRQFQNMERFMRKEDHKIDKAIHTLKHRKHHGRTDDMMKLIKAMRGKGDHKGANKLLGALKKGGYRKHYDDYLKQYDKYYKEWYRRYGPKYHRTGGMGMGMGMMPGMMGGMMGGGMMGGGMMGGGMMGGGMMQPITHVHIHHAVSGAYQQKDNVLTEGDNIQKCQPMHGMEICGKYNDDEDNLQLTVRVGAERKFRDKTNIEERLKSAYAALTNLYDEDEDDEDYDDEDEDDMETFNGRRLVDNYYDDEYDDDDEAGWTEMSDFGDMLGYTLWKAQTMDWQNFDDTSDEIDTMDNKEYSKWDIFGEYQHYLNTIDYDWNGDDWDINDKKRNTKCSAILPGLFARICLHFNKRDKNAKLHFDTASMNEINDILNKNDDDDDDIYSAQEIEAVHNMLNEQYDMKLDWNKDEDWNEIKNIYDHNGGYDDDIAVIDKCHNMFVASICVDSNLNLKINIENGKSLLSKYKSKQKDVDFATSAASDNFYNNYYRNLYDNVYQRVRKQQLKAALVGQRRRIMEKEMYSNN